MLPRACVLAAIVAAASSTGVQAGVVINELMYHPTSVLELEEFVELHNIGTNAVDLAEWCLEGIEFCFPAGATIPADGYLVLGRDPNAFYSTYGRTPDYLYAGELDNGGERLVLRDAQSLAVDEVDYDDEPPWPVTPDELGHSLERINGVESGDTPRNWAGSVGGPSVGAENSAASAVLPPWLSDVAFTHEPGAGEPMMIAIHAEDAVDVQLAYRVNFEPPVTIAMTDDGTGLYAATIPGQAANTLMRFQVMATGAGGVMRYPRADDSVAWEGTKVADPALTSSLPILHWYVDPNDYADALAHFLTDELEPALIFFDGRLYDNVQFRCRGQTSRHWSKKHWKLHFARAHEFNDPQRMPLALDQCDLVSPFSDKAYLREVLSQETLRDVGAPHASAYQVRVQQNGAFYGLYTLRMGADDDYLTYNGLSQAGAWYKAYSTGQYLAVQHLPSYYQKRTRLTEGFQDLHDLLYALHNLTGQARHDYLFENFDLAASITYQCGMVLIHNNDQCSKNYLIYRDTEGTQRWHMQAWDLDLTFGRNYGAGGGVLSDGIWADNDDVGRPPASPSHPLFGDEEHQKWDYLWNRLTNALHDDPDYRAMYYRRLRTLMDRLLAPPYYESRIAELTALHQPEVALDRAKWGTYGVAQTPAEAVLLVLNDYLPRRRDHLFVTHSVPGEIPPPQSPTPPIIISEIMYNAASGADRSFIELYNPSTDEAVDLSDWQLTGVGLQFPPGTVLLSQRYAVAVKNDPAFRAAYPGGRQVLGVYSSAPGTSGGTIELRMPDGVLIDSVHYDDEAPWPTSPDGGGPSLELIDPTRDNARVGNWAPSVAPGGTPALENSVAGMFADLPAVWINEVLADNASVNVDESGDRDAWIELYNAGTAIVDLGGFRLSDDPAMPDKWALPAGTSLAPGGWLLIWVDGEPGEGPLHTSFALPATGGVVVLSDSALALVDTLRVGELPADTAFGRYPDGGTGQSVLAVATPGAANVFALGAPMILNEYNAVDDDKALKNNGADTYWGRIFGNGGDWFELVVTRDHVDARGWQLVISNDTGAAGQTIETLTLTDHPVWADLRVGTIVTISENLADDVSFDPVAGDWWINVRAADNAAGTYITPESFKVSNNNWQLTIRDNLGAVLFGPAGEGVAPVSGIGGDEVFRLAADPSAAVVPGSASYDDSIHSTFGAPNIYDNGTEAQDFTAMRAGAAPCQTDADCDDGNPCTNDVCSGFAGCENAALPDGTSCDDGTFCNGAELCIGSACTPAPSPCQAAAGCDEVGDVCIPCIENAECDDGNPCTIETCVDGACVSVAAADGTLCDDGSFCTASDTCQAGACVGVGSPCPDACTRCDNDLHACVHCAVDLFPGDGGLIGGGDFVVLASFYGACYSPGDPALVADIDGDGCVGAGDFVLLASCYAGPCDACAGCFAPNEE